MKVLFFEPFAIWTPHFETCLEVMQEHINKGASITFIGCDASLPGCEPNPDHHLALCLCCMAKRKKGLKMLSSSSSITYISLNDLCPSQDDDVRKIRLHFANVDDLCSYKIENYDIGMAVASSLMSIYRTPEPDLVQAKDRLSRLFVASYRTYFRMKDYLRENLPDSVYIFNGRFSFLRSVFRICRQNNIDCFTHERGANIHKYAVYKNALPHDKAYNTNEIRNTWDKAPKEQRAAIAERFYYDREAGIQQSWFSFVSSQENGLLPEGWSPGRHNVAIFNSSEDEFAATGEEWKNPLYPNQLIGLKRIVEDLSKYENIHIYLRMHPNLAGVHNQSVEELYHIKANNFTLIPPKAKVSTYALIRSSQNIITFGSTVGIEAAFWGKPSILAGQSLYDGLGSVYLPQNHEELIRLALSRLQPKDRTGALLFGYYCNTFGRDFKHYQADGLFSGKFRGKAIKPPLSVWAIYRLIGITNLQKQFEWLLLPYLKRSTVNT